LQGSSQKRAVDLPYTPVVSLQLVESNNCQGEYCIFGVCRSQLSVATLPGLVALTMQCSGSETSSLRRLWKRLLDLRRTSNMNLIKTHIVKVLFIDEIRKRNMH